LLSEQTGVAWQPIGLYRPDVLFAGTTFVTIPTEQGISAERIAIDDLPQLRQLERGGFFGDDYRLDRTGESIENLTTWLVGPPDVGVSHFARSCSFAGSSGPGPQRVAGCRDAVGPDDMARCRPASMKSSTDNPAWRRIEARLREGTEGSLSGDDGKSRTHAGMSTGAMIRGLILERQLESLA